MKPISEIRRENLRTTIDARGGGAKVAADLGYRSASFFSQMVGPKPSREVTEKSARRFEKDMGLPQGSLDVDHAVQQPVAAPAGILDVSMLTDVLRLMGSVLAAENVTLPPQKFADVAALAVEDAAEHGGKAREAHIRSVVRLLK